MQLLGVNSSIPADVPTCGTAVLTPGAAGIWLKFETGENDTATGVSISTCTSDPLLNGNFDSQMLVFTGSCDQLRCLDGNDNLQQQGCASEAGVSFIANPSMVYRIFVYGRQPGATGDFAVQVSSTRVPPPNNNCNRAQNLNNREPVNATLLDADPPSSDVSGCFSALNYDTPAVWFLYEAEAAIEDDEELIISTCSPASSLGLRISLFLGNCGGLLCMDSPANGVPDEGEGSLNCNGAADSVRFTPQAQATYLILVQSDFAADIGEFSIMARSSIFGLAENDECENATPLTIGFTEEGSTVFATLGNTPPEVCGNGIEPFNSPDLWYSVINSSSNSTVLRATSCTGNTDLDTSDFDSQIFVYSGGCNNLICIDGNDDFGFGNGLCSLRSQVTWLAEGGITYYIRVQGIDAFNVGTFGIKVEMEGPPPNDICEDAILLQSGTVTPSSTVGASTDPGSSCNVLNLFDPVESIGVWFQVLGNDEQYTVATCSGDANLDVSGFDSQISVYSGSSCSDLTCLDFNEGNMGAVNIFGVVPCNTGVSWFASSSESYWVRVFGTNSTGPFPIAVYPTPVNDMCESATLLELNQTVEGTTLGGMLGPEQAVCGAGASPAIPRDDLPGAWYTFAGTGSLLTLSTCTGNSTLDDNGYESQIVIYSGDCNSLTCVAGNDGLRQDECSGFNAGVSWLSNAGEVYYARVYGYITVGTFGLTLFEGDTAAAQCPPPPANDLCENAILLISGLLAPPGTTDGATTESNVGICGDGVVESFSPDVWYQFIGTGGVHTATTCTGISELDSTGFDSQLIIYSGECGSLTCITGNDDNFASTCSGINAGASWLTEEGVTYYIRIMGFSGSTGQFGLRIDDGNTLDSAPVPENNQCQNATMLVLDQIEEGTTIGATTTPGLSSRHMWRRECTPQAQS